MMSVNTSASKNRTERKKKKREEREKEKRNLFLCNIHVLLSKKPLSLMSTPTLFLSPTKGKEFTSKHRTVLLLLLPFAIPSIPITSSFLPSPRKKSSFF